MQVLGLHFRRVQWTFAGQQVKVPGCISFPVKLPASALDAAMAHIFRPGNGALLPLALPAELRPPVAGSNSAESSDAPGDGTAVSPPAPSQQQQQQQSEQESAAAGDSTSDKVWETRSTHVRAAADAAFDLTAAVVHNGGPESGHYTTFRRIVNQVNA